MPVFSLSYVWVFIGAMMIGFGSGWYVVDAVKDNEIKQIKLDQNAKDLASFDDTLKRFQGQVTIINQNAMAFEQFKIDFASATDTLKGQFANATKANPLPPDCKPDNDRVHAITAAIASANAAIATTGR